MVAGRAFHRRPRPHRVLGPAATPHPAPGGPGHLAPAAPPARPVPALPGTAAARRPPAARPGGVAAVAHRHAQGDPQARDRQRDGPRHAGRTRRAPSHTRPLPTPSRQRQQPSTSARPRTTRACLSRAARKRARPVLRGPRRGNAPGYPTKQADQDQKRRTYKTGITGHVQGEDLARRMAAVIGVPTYAARRTQRWTLSLTGLPPAGWRRCPSITCTRDSRAPRRSALPARWRWSVR